MSELVMVEPFRSEFIGLLRNGAGSRDVQDTQDGPFARQVLGDDRMIARELDRVRLHRESLCALLEAHVGPAATVLDVGCGTGGTTVALGTSRILGTRRIVGADADPAAVSAAVARARACGLFGRLSFEVTPAHEALPFETGSFDLTVCVSVLQLISAASARTGGNRRAASRNCECPHGESACDSYTASGVTRHPAASRCT